MGLKFYDYDGLQPKISPPKHFSRQCMQYSVNLEWPLIIVSHFQFQVDPSVESSNIAIGTSDDRRQKHVSFDSSSLMRLVGVN